MNKRLRILKTNKMERLFNYRPEGQTITTNDGDKLLMVIRRGPRGLVGVVRDLGPIVIWDNDSASEHENDTVEELKAKLIEVINA